MSSFALELKLKIINPDGSAFNEASKLTTVDGFGHRIITKSALFLNSIQVESNVHFGLWNSVYSYLYLDKGSLETIGQNMLYKSLRTKIHSNITQSCFENQPSEEVTIQKLCKTGIHICTPLAFDISSANFYLLNGVDLRIRLDLASAKTLINSTDGIDYSYEIEHAKLWCQRIVPIPQAILSLSRNLANNNSEVEYMFDRPIIKTFIFGVNHTSLNLDNLFAGYIPSKLFLFFIKQSAYNGSYLENAAFLSHCNMSSIELYINGNTVSSHTVEFPDSVANIFHYSLFNLNSKKNLLSLDDFKNGRTILTWDLRSNTSEETISVEKTGNIRLYIHASKPNTENYIAFVVGLTTGAVSIDANRRIKTSFLM